MLIGAALAAAGCAPECLTVDRHVINVVATAPESMTFEGPSDVTGGCGTQSGEPFEPSPGWNVGYRALVLGGTCDSEAWVDPYELDGMCCQQDGGGCVADGAAFPPAERGHVRIYGADPPDPTNPPERTHVCATNVDPGACAEHVTFDCEPAGAVGSDWFANTIRVDLALEPDTDPLHESRWIGDVTIASELCTVTLHGITAQQFALE